MRSDAPAARRLPPRGAMQDRILASCRRGPPRSRRTNAPRGLRACRSPGTTGPSRRCLGQGKESFQQRLSVAGALLRVVLDAEERALADDGGNPHPPVLRDRMSDAIGRLAAIGVSEVSPA